ncbi:hypothetical protein TL16_g02063 [Triparma laevis f. inornata]|uniref:SURF1-like protein n=1 Tax=Triparma laevis f. inornata TaxID=1714386 RepID=A0A9W6ZS38_9STRA|nr:hypothetical protein TL16_g02063 [Triparma laevis f. inornata]
MNALTAPLFGGLCVGTAGLGMWQRYYDKIELIEKQAKVLADPSRFALPLEDPRLVTTQTLTGRYLHEDEVLLGPRGPPPGALSKDGPNSGRGGGGIASSPQGYYVITPFLLTSGTSRGEVVLVNRGWDQRHMKKKVTDWDWVRPRSNLVQIKAVTQKFEEGGTFAPPPIAPPRLNSNFATPKTIFLWLKEEELKKATGVTDAAVMYKALNTGAVEVEGEVENLSSNQSPPSSSSWFGFGSKPKPKPSSPSPPPLASLRRQLLKPDIVQAVEFKISPETHAGYAATWFSLSTAGIILTRKLLRQMPK